jgi:predicted HTH transcriptional regulator
MDIQKKVYSKVEQLIEDLFKTKQLVTFDKEYNKNALIKDLNDWIYQYRIKHQVKNQNDIQLSVFNWTNKIVGNRRKANLKITFGVFTDFTETEYCGLEVDVIVY